MLLALVAIVAAQLQLHDNRTLYWTVVNNTYCDSEFGSYTTRAEAEAACETTAGCLSIFDSSCDGEGNFTLCTCTESSIL